MWRSETVNLYCINKGLKNLFPGDKLIRKKMTEVPMMYKLIAFDLDGTFLDDNKKIPEENLRAITFAAEQGAQIVPATGRLSGGIPKEISSLPFVRYYILINGAKVYDSVEDRIVSAAELSVDTALSLFERGRSLGCLFDCYVDDRGYMEKKMFDRLPEIADNPAYLAFMQKMRTPVDDLPSFVRENAASVQKVQYFFTKDMMDERERQLSLLSKDFPEIKPASSISFNIEINSVHAGKGPAIAALCRELNISLEETIAFGDGMNDLDMISVAGMGVAMSNSEPELLRIANKITGSNNEAGVAKAIYELF